MSLTWSKPNGTWGINGVDDLGTLPPSVYGAVMKLHCIEKLVGQINDPLTESCQQEDLRHELDCLLGLET